VTMESRHVVDLVARYPLAVDRIFTLREVVMRTARGQIAPATAARMIERTVLDAGIERSLNGMQELMASKGFHNIAIPHQGQRFVL